MKEPNLTNTAKRLGMTQPAVSMALQRLRSLYNDPLFVREGRKMLPSEKAHQLHPQISQALDIITQTIPDNFYFDPSTANINFKVNIFSFAEQLIAAEFFEKLSNVSPKSSIIITSEYIQAPEQMLRNRSIDIHLDFNPIDHIDFHSLAIHSQKMVVIARVEHSRLKDKTLLTMADYLAEKHAISGTLEKNREIMKGFISEDDFTQFNQREIGYHGSSELGVMSMVRKSDMLTIMPAQIVTALQDYSNFLHFPVPFDCKEFITYLNWYAGIHHDKGHRWFREFIIANAKSLMT
jgi:LysR family transcriptional activator for leuABCD operon